MMSEDGTQATKSVDLKKNSDIVVKISDALNEQDIVKFTIQTQSSLERFKKKKYQVMRLHSDFIWLHDRIVENAAYAGYLIPPCPPKPDFSQSHGKLAKLQAGDSSMTQAEIEKLKTEIQAEYLVAFQKTVAMHEVFLLRLVSHTHFREDSNLDVFLTYESDLAGKSKSTKEKAFGLMRSMTKSIDNSFTSFKEPDMFFETARSFILTYQARIKDACSKASAKQSKRLLVASHYGTLGTQLNYFGNTMSTITESHVKENSKAVGQLLRSTGDAVLKLQVVEKKLASREDLKMTDLLRYYVADTQAARELLHRRIRALMEQDKTEKASLAAQAKGKKVAEAQEAAASAKEKASSISETCQQEIEVFKARRVEAFRKYMIQYCQSQIKQARESYACWKELNASIKSDDSDA